MINQECVDWPGAALVAQLPRRPRNLDQQRQDPSKESFQRFSQLLEIKRFIEARLHEVARVLRVPSPRFCMDHRGKMTLNGQPIQLDLSQIEALRIHSSNKVCKLTLLRAFLAGLFVQIIKGDWFRQFLPTTQGKLASIADFLSGYVLAAFRATFETRRAFLQEIVPLPSKQSSLYQDRLTAFEQGQLAFQPAT